MWLRPVAIPYGVLFAVAIGFTTLIPYLPSAFTIVPGDGGFWLSMIPARGS